MSNLVKFAREPWQRKVCRMTGMACMSHVESACICKHEADYKQVTIALNTGADFWTQRHELYAFAKTGGPPALDVDPSTAAFVRDGQATIIPFQPVPSDIA